MGYSLWGHKELDTTERLHSPEGAKRYFSKDTLTPIQSRKGRQRRIPAGSGQRTTGSQVSHRCTGPVLCVPWELRLGSPASPH